MTVFSIGSLSDWVPVVVGEPLYFDVAPSGYRQVRFDLLAASYVTVSAVTAAGEVYLVAAGQGLLEVRFSASEWVSLVISGPADVPCMLRGYQRSQLIEPSGEVTFTTIEPRSPQPNMEFQRIMRLVQLQAQRREQMLLDQMEALKAAQPAPVDEVVEGAGSDRSSSSDFSSAPSDGGVA